MRDRPEGPPVGRAEDRRRLQMERLRRARLRSARPPSIVRLVFSDVKRELVPHWVWLLLALLAVLDAACVCLLILP